MKFWFVRIGQINGSISSITLFKFECIDEALDFIKITSKAVFTQHVEITLLGEEDI